MPVKLEKSEKKTRYEVVACVSGYGYWVLDKTIEDGEVSSVFGSASKAQAEKHCAELNASVQCDACLDVENDPACQQCCEHQFDMSEGGMCLLCNRDDYYNFMDEDAGSDR